MKKLVILLSVALLLGCPASNGIPAPTKKSTPWGDCSTPNDKTYRTETPEGWLLYTDGYESASVVFIPDPKKTWAAPTTWEDISGASDKIYRAKTPTGWVVYCDGYESVSTTFVPDPTHKWDLSPKK